MTLMKATCKLSEALNDLLDYKFEREGTGQMPVQSSPITLPISDRRR